MRKIFIYSFLISLCTLIFAVIPSLAKEKTFVSLSPALTEVMYALDAQNQLLGVSALCNYPKEALMKEKIGDAYYINKEKLLRIKPDYILAMDGRRYFFANLQKFGVTPLYFEMNSVNSIYNTILALGRLTGKTKNAEMLVKSLEADVNQLKPLKQKKILYLVQLNPFITVGNKSFISDVIKKSGQISVTNELNGLYPAVSDEYILQTNPDVIVVSFKSDNTKLKKLFPKTKIIYLSEEENDFINRPGTRVNLAVKFFYNL